MTEQFSARCRRVLVNGPAAPDDYEAARYLIDQGLADGRCGPPSKSRDNYGKITQVIWFGITPAGRLWLERISAGANPDQAEIVAELQGNHQAEHVTQQSLDAVIEAITRPTKPQSTLVKIALGVFAGFLILAVGYLFRTHLGIPL